MVRPKQRVIVYQNGVTKKRKQTIEVDQNHKICEDCGRIVGIVSDGSLRMHDASPKDKIVCRNGGKYYGR